MPNISRHSSITPAYTGRMSTTPVPALRLPDECMEPVAAYRFIHDELMLDGSSRLNLATFVTTWMDPEAQELMAETFDKNMIDKDEYPVTAAIEQRCVSMVADLFHAENLRDDDPSAAVGVSTVGSSEAVMRIVYDDLGGTTRHAMMELRPAGGSWGTPTQLTTAPSDNSTLATVAVDPWGHALAGATPITQGWGTRFDTSIEQRDPATEPTTVFPSLAPSSVEVGDVFNGAKVVKTTTFGAFVELTKGVDGLLHISNLAAGRVDKVEDVINRGDTVDVTVVEVDKARGTLIDDVVTLLKYHAVTAPSP